MSFGHAVVIITLASLIPMILYATSVDSAAWATGLCILLIAVSLYVMFGHKSGATSPRGT